MATLGVGTCALGDSKSIGTGLVQDNAHCIRGPARRLKACCCSGDEKKKAPPSVKNPTPSSKATATTAESGPHGARVPDVARAIPINHNDPYESLCPCDLCTRQTHGYLPPHVCGQHGKMDCSGCFIREC